MATQYENNISSDSKQVIPIGMSIERKTRSCLNTLMTDIITPITRFQRKLERLSSSRRLAFDVSPVVQSLGTFQFSQRFVPTDIQEAVRRNVDQVDRLDFVHGHTNFTVELYTARGGTGDSTPRSRLPVGERRSRLIQALAITVGMSKWSLCGLEHAKVVIKMFDIDSPKKFAMDGLPITPSQVNSAYTIPCRYASGSGTLEVVIFRREEWTKVLFHELMHLYSYDISSNDKRINTRLSRIFNVTCDFNLTEAYAEFWARVLWTMWVTDGVGRRFAEEMERQRIWSIRQGVTVLMNTNLVDVVFGTRGRRIAHGTEVCKETTAAFSYYVICGIMMTEWECVLAWCCEANAFPMMFTSGFDHVSSFITLIRELKNEDFVIDDWKEQATRLARRTQKGDVSARMTKA